MKTYTPEELKEILHLHSRWLSSEKGGKQADLYRADLRHANLSYANLIGADLRYANLIGADLRYANLLGSRLLGANLRHANMLGAQIECANLSFADLRHADMTNAKLHRADLTDVNLANANLSGADLRQAHLAGVNFASCTGVQYVQFSFQGLGSAARQWSAVKIDGEWRAFCGCWSGSLGELKTRVYEPTTLSRVIVETRMEGYNMLVHMCAVSDKAAASA